MDDIVDIKFFSRFTTISIINIVLVSIFLAISIFLLILLNIFVDGITDNTFGSLSDNIQSFITSDEETNNGLQEQYNTMQNLGVTDSDYNSWSVAVYSIMLIFFQFIFMFRTALYLLILILLCIVLSRYKNPYKYKFCSRILIINIVCLVLLFDILSLVLTIALFVLIKREKNQYYLEDV